jgi:hypothetical protein
MYVGMLPSSNFSFFSAQNSNAILKPDFSNLVMKWTASTYFFTGELTRKITREMADGCPNLG